MTLDRRTFADRPTLAKELAEAIKPWHEITAFAMAGLVVLHVAGALKHHIVDRDGLLSRMLP